MPSPEGVLNGGELNAAITSALVGIHHEHFRRGPTSASTFHRNNVLVTIMHEVQTPAARRLVQRGHAAEVQRMRQLFVDGLEDDCAAAIQRITKRNVLAFIAGSAVEPDVSAWVFVLDGDVGTAPSGASERSAG